MAHSTMEDLTLPPFICSEGKDHRPTSIEKRNKAKFWMFGAAHAGCLCCTKFCIEVLGIDQNSESENRKYTALDWAQWGVEKNVFGAKEVVTYLQSKPRQAADNMYPGGSFPPFICAQGKDHCPRSYDKRGKTKFWMFCAAYQGCLACTKFCIEVLRVGVNSESENRRYKAADWAQWGVEQGVEGAEEVQFYLRWREHVELLESSSGLLAIENGAP